MAPDFLRSARHTGPLRILALVAAVLVLLVLLWDWNWLKPLVEARASAELDREVHLNHFEVARSWHPLLTADGVTIANPAGFDEPAFAKADRISARVDLRRLLRGELKLDELIVQHPTAELQRAASGQGNWLFPLLNHESEAEPEIASLTITEGRVHLLDPKVLNADMVVNVETQASGGEPQLLATLTGTYNNQEIRGRFIGGSIVMLRDPAHPYPVDLKLAHGSTRMSAVGSVLDPVTLGDADITLEMTGNDMADLYELTGLPLPHTARYRLRGALDYDAGSIRFTHFTGMFGESDIAGELVMSIGRGKRMVVNSTLTSRHMVLADLGGVIGAAPGTPGTPSQAPEHDAARAAAAGRMLPDMPISLPKVRAVDAHVHFTGAHIAGNKMPLDKMVAQIDIIDGRIGIKPLSFKVGDGDIVMNLALDAQKDLVRMAADVDFRQLDLAYVIDKLTIFKGAGTVAGQARIAATGNSMASMLAHGDGELQLFTEGGDLSSLLVNLAGLDLGKSLLSFFGIPRQTDLHCAVADYELTQGILNTRLLLIDTAAANILGEGTINLRDETVDYKLKTEPKHPSMMQLHGPINITGSWSQPRIWPDKKVLMPRGVAATVLGVLAVPLGKLLPSLRHGLGKDNQCARLVDEARAAAKQTGAKGSAQVRQRHAPAPTSPKAQVRRPGPAPAK